MRFMCFANPVLLTLLMSAKLDIFIDATFSMTPSPFYQTFIVMVYDRQTMMYVPVMYFLMTHKVQELYMHVFQQIIVLSKYRINVNSYTSDFERAIINAAKHYFPEGFHNGCFFHFKQAIRKHMIEVLYFHKALVSLFMDVGKLDLLTVIPVEEILPYGIPYLRELMESDLTYLSDIYESNHLDFVEEDERERWDQFWDYFSKQWLPIKDSWNISGEDDQYRKYVNRTNNALESYNRRFQELFKRGGKVKLLEFVEITEKESRQQAQYLDDIRNGRRKQPTRDNNCIPKIPVEYLAFKQRTLKKAGV